MHIYESEQLSSSQGKDTRKKAFPVWTTVKERPLNSYIKARYLVTEKEKKMNPKTTTNRTSTQKNPEEKNVHIFLPI